MDDLNMIQDYRRLAQSARYGACMLVYRRIHQYWSCPGKTYGKDPTLYASYDFTYYEMFQ